MDLRRGINLLREHGDSDQNGWRARRNVDYYRRCVNDLKGRIATTTRALDELENELEDCQRSLKEVEASAKKSYKKSSELRAAMEETGVIVLENVTDIRLLDQIMAVSSINCTFYSTSAAVRFEMHRRNLACYPI